MTKPYTTPPRRVVITGLGTINPIGLNVQSYWENLIHGVSGIRKITQFDASQLPCQIAGEIIGFDPYEYIEKKEARRIPRSAQIAYASAVQAISDAKLINANINPERVGVVIGTAIGGADRIDEGIQVLRTQGFERVNPFIIPSGIPNLSAFFIAKEFHYFGPNLTITTACASGTHAIGEGCELIRQGRADIILAGGTEALIRDFAIAGFSAMRALPTSFNDDPQKASRPFDLKREGFVFSEGAAVLVLESLEHALSRQAPIYGEIIGHASSTDAYHVAQPDPTGSGAVRTMLWAVQDAGIQPSEIEYINAHGSSTPLNDAAETKAIKTLFQEHAYKLFISSTKSMIGHAMGASGALEAIATVLAIKHKKIPPTINYEYPDPECDLNYVPNQAITTPLTTALSNSFGLGGQNSTLVLKEFKL
ncbi:MAG: beta-ketoacyl-ACP synthase II [Anaerolineales bacterium]